MIWKKNAKRNKTQKNEDVEVEYEDFDEWWDQVAHEKVSTAQDEWMKDNEPNEDPDEPGGDYWFRNQMMHDGEAHRMTSESAEEAFDAGLNGEKWSLGYDNALGIDDLDAVIRSAYEAGKHLAKQ